ncbi:cyclohexanone monooxygenase [Thalassobaculum fulvum]|uniref:Cyclohexanone monooxygenase n=1 Tax=Thalassobaculum fulvum TaxID=1633335 RepID=A0A918XWC8_9PROT|nr:NAD(P)/FAD-dependent oxidoreductase [Thalassobaculum fulvum]GHD61217.1 cyclohexanone monooxygenase [Thalassobaculum fulvum]
MNAIAEQSARVRPAEALDHDVLIVGAGISGMYQLLLLRRLGMRVQVFEAGTGVGGTWYWNRYPGARFDSESWSYGFSFDQELLDEWDWTENFAPQPETERYLNHFADKFDLRRDIRFSSRVTAAHWDDDGRFWTLTLEDGSRHTARFLVSAVGPLSAPTYPRLPGLDDFEGEAYHTGLWPKHEVSFAGKRVAVIGTGASAVQAIPIIAETAEHLTVFQRRPNWCTPLHNARIDKDEMARIRARYPEIFQRCRETAACFIHTIDPRGTFEVTPEEREAFWEQRYAEPGFGIWQGNFRDVLIDRKANALLSDFVARKIRERVNDPEVAEKLIPKDHGFGTRRVPQETRYYEAYNRPNVELVSILETPIERITPTGLRTSERDYAFDMIVYATGFDAITGGLDRIDLRGRDGVKLKDRWRGNLSTFVGVMVDGFPNMFMQMGPHTALGNIPRSIEYGVEWVRDLLAHMQAHDLTLADARGEAVRDWTAFVAKKAEGLLSNEVDSWMTGVNMNVEGKQTRIVARYSGTAGEYRDWCNRVAAEGYREIAMG